MARFVPFSVIIACLGGIVPANAGAASQITFEGQVRPVLKAHCFHCHGEGEKLNGGVDLRLRRFMAEKKTDQGPVLDPGKASSSVMLKLIRSGEMPKGEKKLAEKEIALIEQWITEGAKTAREEPLELPKGFHITEQERQFWAFQPIQKPRVPEWSKADGVRTSIDVFVLKKLREQNLKFAPEADKLTLIRRVYFDLLGLPPSPEAVDEFIADKSPDAYERLVDKVLESSSYGERWGRHWLDVAGYADSNGYAEADSVRVHAWRYRDYVIRAFNDDKPWKQFVAEQLSGDELAGVTASDAVTKASDSRVQELLAATGFLRMGPDGTGDEVPDQNAARNQVVAETIKIVSSSLLGLSVGCAQCHDHRYDPISQADYYQLRAIFDPAFDWKKWRTPSQRLVSLYSAGDRRKADEIEVAAKKIDDEANQMRKDFLEDVFKKEIARLPEEIREEVKTARNTERNKRSAEQIALLKKYPSADVQGALDLYDPPANKKVEEKKAEGTKLRGTKPPEPFLACVTEPGGAVPESFVFNRGDHDQPRQKVEPLEMQILQPALAAWDAKMAAAPGFGAKDPKLASSGRRLAYARWLTSGNHPLVARVLVNRFWMNHFGRGLVNSPGDFGTQGERPTHPELLDWLAKEFVEGGWKLKPLHKLIMISAVYRQSSVNDASLRVDPDNRFYGRMKLQRFDAETLRDSILAVSGKLNREQFGPAVPIARDDAGRVVAGNQKNNGNGDPVLVDPIGDRAFRRSIYVEVRRTLPLTVLESFDAPVMSPNCELRNVSTVAPQSLTMLNDSFVSEQSKFFAERLVQEYPGNAREQVKRAWRLVYDSVPKEEELTRNLAYLAEQAEQIRSHLQGKAVLKSDKAPPPLDPQKLALASFCQALMSANRFLYVD